MDRGCATDGDGPTNMMGIRRIFNSLTGKPDGAQAGAAGIFHAARDMTEYDRIRELVHWADDELERGRKSELTLDLSRLVRMDTSFLAGIVLVCRRAKAHDVVVRIRRFPKHFDALVDLYRVRGALRKAGVVFEDPIDDDGALSASAKAVDSSASSLS